MFTSLTLFFPLKVTELEFAVNSFGDHFDLLLKDNFSDEELLIYEDKIDSIGAFFVQPVLNELCFDDFYFHPDQESEQRRFFNDCKSSISVENIPYLENNPFQVTYFVEFFKGFNNVLIDPGGVFELMFKNQFLSEIKGFKGIDSLLNGTNQKEALSFAPLREDPVQSLIIEVYKELDRLKLKLPSTSELSEKAEKIYLIMSSQMNSQKWHGADLMKQTGLNPKDFGDALERLKFWLKKF
jgi:hypothetical protein